MRVAASADAVPGRPSAAARAGTPLERIRAEVAAVLDAVDAGTFDRAAAFLGDRGGAWFFTGQGRSGLVAQMAAMRFGHLGRRVHVVGEATAPALAAGDHLVALSASGTTPVTLHLARTARSHGADLLAVTARADGELAALAGEVLLVPAGAGAQFGGSLFEQSALLVLDALALRLGGDHPAGHVLMQTRHANLQ